MMIDHKLIDFHCIPGYLALLDGFRKQPQQTLISLPRSARLPFLAAIQSDLARTILFITSKPDRLQAMHNEFGFWGEGSNQEIFAEPSPLFFEKAEWGPSTRLERLNTLYSLAQGFIPANKAKLPPTVIFSSVKAVMTKTIPRRDFIKYTLSLRIDQEKDLNQITSNLVTLNFEPVEIVTNGGQFARRGGILDVWAPNTENPVRIEFFGDQIDTMRYFDPVSQRSTGKVDQIILSPAREFLNTYSNSGEDSLHEKRTEFDIPSIFPNAGSILNYLSKDAIIIFDNAASLQVTADEIETQSFRIRDENESTGLIPKHSPDPFFSWSELLDEISFRHSIDLGYPLEESGHQISSSFSPSPRYGSRIDKLFEFLQNQRSTIGRVFIVSKQCERVKEIEKEIVLDEILKENIAYIDASLNSGWQVQYSEQESDFLFTDSELFGWELPQPRYRKHRAITVQENLFFDFNEGDYVVHVDYGIALFEGLVHREIEGIARDYLLLHFADADELFVPIHQADRINFYIGPDSRKPKLSKLGSETWKNNRQNARKAVKAIAYDLLELYAKRQTIKGYAFNQDTEWQHALESSFPYRETDDQEKAIIEVKKDMEKDRPMDRLLCGDVGYGKTEVAVRAAFKAIMDNRQVAMLVPTTILAQQHFETFRSRLSPFPVKIEMLSRFRSASQQANILLQLESGDVDIVIGTHRLLQQDVLFKNLGLLIIDEEQRFGVAHKEYFKKMRQEIDVLTLTATPIPRTLYMALSGIRDISVINSPPSDRLPIQTFTGPYDERVVRRAIIREIDRGGQVFFVHNRVQSIQTVAAQLRKLVPEATIAIGHGQMKEKMLADVMQKFTAGEIDILLSTSIIESGLDIPNANTLILDRADTFGLAQLYQLRGRVGRGSSHAYAYFFHHNRKLPTPDGLERLEVIAENTQLGAGYSIAMRDLEMRGAGDLLGSEQHGYIAAIGFHLYTRLLTEAVQELKGGQRIREKLDEMVGAQTIRPIVNIELPISALIPSTYIENDSLRLQLYRRIAEIKDNGKLNEIQAELADRFGEIPESVQNLLYQMRVKLKAELCGIHTISVENNHLVLRFPIPDDNKREYILPEFGKNIRRGKHGYWMPVENVSDWRVRLLKLLDDIKNFIEENHGI